MSRLAPVAPPFHLPFPPTPVPGAVARRPSYDVLGDPLHVLLTAEESRGERSVFLMEHRPGSAVPSHVHDDKTEAFHVLEGAYVFEVGGGRRRVEAGSSALVPAGTSHGFRVDGTERAAALVVSTPGGLEAMFRALDGFRMRGPEDLPALTAILERHGTHLVAPVAGPA